MEGAAPLRRLAPRRHPDRSVQQGVTALILLVPSVAFMLVIERFLRAEVLAKVGG